MIIKKTPRVQRHPVTRCECGPLTLVWRQWMNEWMEDSLIWLSSMLWPPGGSVMSNLTPNRTLRMGSVLSCQRWRTNHTLCRISMRSLWKPPPPSHPREHRGSNWRIIISLVSTDRGGAELWITVRTRWDIKPSTLWFSGPPPPPLWQIISDVMGAMSGWQWICLELFRENPLADNNNTRSRIPQTTTNSSVSSRPVLRRCRPDVNGGRRIRDGLIR